MLRERLGLFSATAFVAALLGSDIVHAGELSVNLRETDNGVVVELRGLAADAARQEVITSKTGALLFLPQQTSPVKRIAAPPKHRLDYVQVGQAGPKVAVRIVQRKRANGSLGKFMRSESVAGGLDVYVEDGVKPAAEPIAMPTATVEPARDETTRAALAKLAHVDAPAEPVAPEPVAAAIEPAPEPEPEPAKVETPTTDMQDAKAAPRNEPPKHAGAFDESFAESATPPSGRTMGWIAIASLCAFAGLALWKAKKRRMPDQLESLRVVSKVALGPKQQIVWLVAGDRAMLVGATEQSIALISDLGRVRNESSLDFPVAAPAPASDPTAGNKVAAFKQRLRVALSDEMAARSDAAMPEHLELLTSEPKWAQRKESA